MPTTTSQVGSDADDAQYLHGSFWDDTYFDIGYDDSVPDYADVWARFPSVSVPQGATIDSAYLKVQSPSSQTSSVDGVIEAQDEDDAAQLTSASGYEGASWTTASVSWTPGDWSADTWYSSPDLSSVIQEIVDRGGWAEGNHLGLRWRDDDESSSGLRSMKDYGNGISVAAQLEITYHVPAQMDARAQGSFSAAASRTVRVSMSAAASGGLSASPERTRGAAMDARGQAGMTAGSLTVVQASMASSAAGSMAVDAARGSSVQMPGQGGATFHATSIAHAAMQSAAEGSMTVAALRAWPVRLSVPESGPDVRRLHLPGEPVLVLTDGDLLRDTSEETLDLSPETEIREMLRVAYHEPPTRFSPLDEVKLTWSEASDAERYELYRSDTSGDYDDPLKLIEAGEDSYEVLDGPLEDGTWYYKLKVYDEAGNTDSTEISVTISSAPEPPSGLSYSISGGTLELSWSASPSGDVDHYNVYRALDGYLMPLDGPHATPASSPWSEDISSVSGRLTYLVRAVDADGNEEANIGQMVALDVDAGAEVGRPNSPNILRAVPVAGGDIEVDAGYSREGEDGEAAELRLYTNGGAGGAVDYGTVVDTASLDNSEGQRVTLTASGLTDGDTYRVSVRAATSGGVEDTNTETAEATADATAPGGAGFSGEVV